MKGLFIVANGLGLGEVGNSTNVQNITPLLLAVLCSKSICLQFSPGFFS